MTTELTREITLKGRNQAVAFMREAVRTGTREQVNNHIAMLEYMSCEILAAIAFNCGNPTGEFKKQDTFAAINEMNLKIFSYINEMEKQIGTKNLEHVPFEEGVKPKKKAKAKSTKLKSKKVVKKGKK